MERKFKLEDAVRIVKDSYADYGLRLGESGTVIALGMKHSGVFTYVVQVGRSEFRVYEPDLETV